MEIIRTDAMIKIPFTGCHITASAKDLFAAYTIPYVFAATYSDQNVGNGWIEFPLTTQIRERETMASFLLETGEVILLDSHMAIIYRSLNRTLFHVELTDYEAAVQRTVGTFTSSSSTPFYDQETMAMLLGLAGETGKLVDLVKKMLYHQHPKDFTFLQKMRLECGDVLWYLTGLAQISGKTLSQLFEEDVYTSTNDRGDIALICLFLVAEAGKCVEAFQAHKRNEMQFALATFLYYYMNVLRYFSFHLDEVMCMNIAKLQKRYPV